MSTELVVHVAEGDVLPPSATLDELIHHANYQHELVGEALGQALQHVILAGAALNEARNNHVAFKGWEAWVEENFDGGHTVASHYMRIYEYRDLIAELPNVAQALKRLQGMPALRRPGYRGYSPEVREEARALAGSGMTNKEISDIIGASPGTIRNWLDPEALKQHRERVKKYSAERKAEQRRKKQEAAQRAAEKEAKRVGGSIAEAYSLVHKLEAPLARAARETNDPEVRKLLDRAGYFQRMSMYRIIEALGRS